MATSDSANASETGQLLALLAIGLPGYSTYLLCISVLQAMRDTRTAFFLYLFENAANIILAVLLTSHIGARGLSLSLSIAYSLAAVAALVVVRRRMGGLGGLQVGRFVARSLILSVAMGAAVAVVTALVSGTSETGLLLEVVAGVIAGVLTYGAAAGLAGTVSGWQTARKRRPGPRRHAHGYDRSRH